MLDNFTGNRGSSVEIEQGFRAKITGTEKILGSSPVETGGHWMGFDNPTFWEKVESSLIFAEKMKKMWWMQSSGPGLVGGE